MSKTVDSESRVDYLNEATSMPSKITTDDGRELLVTKWAPVIEVGQVVRIEASFIVKMPDGKIVAT